MIVIGILLIIIEIIISFFTGGAPILLIAIALIPAFIAKNKGRDFWTWYVYGNLLWIFAIIHSCVIKEDRAYVEQEQIYSSDLKKCPDCGELIKSEAIVCRYCGKNFSTSSSTSSSSSSSSSYSYSSSGNSGNYWYCSKCGCSNTDDLNWCKSCNGPRYTMATLTEKQKADIKEYVEHQLAANTFEEIIKFQDSYFGTTSLKYMTLMLPDAKGFDDLELYKTKLKEAIEEKAEKKEEDKKDSSQDSSTPASQGTIDLEAELTKIKNLFEKNLITEDEYKAKKNQLLGL